MVALRYRSWLPTVSGRLSFSSFGHSKHPNPTNYKNRGAGGERYLLCRQRRIGIDAAIPFQLAQTFLKRDGDFTYVALCKAERYQDRAEEILTGRVFILQRKALGTVSQFLSNLSSALESYLDADQSGPLSEYVATQWTECITELDAHCAFGVDVEICRSGKTTITADTDDFERNGRPSLGDDASSQTRFAHLLCAQIFYFLRDIGHQHQHHDPATDTIVDIFPFDGTDDFAWREQVLYNIYRTIIQYKRNPKNRQFHECLGLLAYASTFVEVSKQELTPATAEKLPYFNASGLEKSLSSMQAVSQLHAERAKGRNSMLQNIILWVVGFVVSVIGLLQVTETKIENPSEILTWFGRFAVQSTEYLSGMVLCAIFVTAMIHSETRFNPKKSRLIIGLVRLVSAWPVWLSGGLFVTIGLAILYLLYRLTPLL